MIYHWKYRDVTLTGDIFFVNKITFFITRSRHIQFSTIETIVNREPATILKAFTHVRQIYMQRGFRASLLQRKKLHRFFFRRKKMSIHVRNSHFCAILAKKHPHSKHKNSRRSAFNSALIQKLHRMTGSVQLSN
jgi:hypothetical protein